jgi:hypothetical protein
VQEHILHIKLVNRPGAGDDQREHGANRGWLDHRAESLIVVDAGSLGEATRRTQRTLYRSKESSELNLCMKIHLLVTTLEPTGRGTRSQVLLAIKAANSSSMAWHQFGSTRAAWTKEGTSNKVDVEVIDRVSLSVGSQKPRFAHVVIG